MFFQSKIIKKLQKNNLIGRGCNNFLVANKWLAVKVAKSTSKPAAKFVVCNVSESEPGMFKDRYLLENFCAEVVAGLKISLDYIGAEKGFIYLNPEYFLEFQEKLNQEIKIQKINNIELYEKPAHDYIGGEETALLNSMQGKRVEPRLKPPFPTTNGFLNQPTIVNNCETFYTVSLINQNKYKQTRFYCLSGHGFGEQVKELPLNLTVKKVLDAFGHKTSEQYFYQVGGGAAGFCYNHKQLNRELVGNPSIIIYRKDTQEKDLILNWLKFFNQESCGQCVPCREGTHRLYKIFSSYYEKTNGGEIEYPYNSVVVKDLIFNLEQASFCGLGKVAANAITSYWKNVKK